MQERIVKISGAVLILAAVMLGGYFFGVHAEQLRNERRAEELAQADDSDRGTKIAIVNLDEGVDTDNGRVQYAAQLLPYAGVDYTATGLQDARLGVETGLYSSYVIIPSDFSQTVYSINSQPAASRLSFTISGELSEEKREQAVYNIEALKENLNNSLTEVYLSSVMKEFHRAQDVSDEIMANDEKDAKLLEAVNAGELIAMVELPEMAQVENTVTELDLTKQYADSGNLLTSLGSSYQGFLEKGQNDISLTAAKSGELSARMQEAESVLAEANRAWEDISFDEELKGLEEKGGQVKAELEAVIRQYDAYLEEYNGIVEASNVSRSGLRTALSEYERVETAYQGLLEKYKAGVNGDHYAFIDREAYIKKLGEMLDNAGIGAVPAPYLTWEEYIKAVTDQMPEDEYCQTAALIPDYAPGMNDPGEAPWPEIQTVQGLSGIRGDDGADLKTAILDKVDGITQAAGAEVTGIFASKTESILENYRQAAEKFREAGAGSEELYTELGGYHMASYIDEREVGAIENDLLANMQEVETAVSEYTGAYGQYVSGVYKAAGDNLAAIQESVADAEERSEKLLTEGLEEAKISRSANKEVNSMLLGELSEKLPYTRLGDVENKEVYDFIASPLQFEQAEPEPQKGEQASREVKAESEINQKTSSIIILLLICGTILAGIIRLALMQRTRRQALEF